MSQDMVINTICWISRYYLDFDQLTKLIPEILNDRVITQTAPTIRADDTAQVYGSEAQIALMRRIRDAVLAERDPDTIYAMRAQVASVEEGPMFFDVVKILWASWVGEYILSLQYTNVSDASVDGSSDDNVDMDDGSESDADTPHNFGNVRRTGNRRLGPSQTNNCRLSVLLMKLQKL